MHYDGFLQSNQMCCMSFFCFHYAIIFITANVHGFNRKNFYQNVFRIFFNFVLHSTGTLGSKIYFIKKEFWS